MSLQSRHAPRSALLLPALLGGGALLLAWARFAGDAVWQRLVFAQGTDRHMDFFNCMVEAASLHVYEASGSIYPPLANLVYYVLGKFLSLGTSGTALRATQAGAMLYGVFTWTLLAALALLAAQAVGGAWQRRLAAGVLCLATAPVVYAVERGNLVLLAVALSFVFLLWQHSETALLREVAIISLALAANLKIYPALLGLLLLCEKRGKAAVRCALYAASMFFVPFLFMGGRSGLLALLASLSFTDGKFGVAGYGYKIDFGNTAAVLAGLFGNTAPPWQAAGAWLGWGILAVGVCTLPFVHSRWRRATVLCACIAGGPGFSYQYNLCYLLPAAALFFAQTCPAGGAAQEVPPTRERETARKAGAALTGCGASQISTLWYALLLAGCLVPLPFAPWQTLALLPGVYVVSATALCGSVCLLLLAVSLAVHGLADAWRALGAVPQGAPYGMRGMTGLTADNVAENFAAIAGLTENSAAVSGAAATGLTADNAAENFAAIAANQQGEPIVAELGFSDALATKNKVVCALARSETHVCKNGTFLLCPRICRALRAGLLGVVLFAALCLCVGTAVSARAFAVAYEAQTLVPVREVLALSDTPADRAVLAVPHSGMAYRALGVQPDAGAPSVPASAQFNISYYVYAPLQAALLSEKQVVLSPEVYRHWQLAAQAEQGDGFASMFAVAAVVNDTALLRRAPQTDLHTLLLAAQGEQIWLVHLRDDGSVSLAGFPKTREWQGLPPEDPATFLALATANGGDMVVSTALLKNGLPQGCEIVQQKGAFSLLRHQSLRAKARD